VTATAATARAAAATTSTATTTPTASTARATAAAATGATRVRMGRSVYWLLDQPAFAVEDADKWKPLDEGTLVITPRRLGFDGAHAVTIPLGDIVNFSVFRDGLLIRTDTTPDQVFRFAGDVEVIGTVLGVVLRQSREASAGGGR